MKAVIDNMPIAQAINDLNYAPQTEEHPKATQRGSGSVLQKKKKRSNPKFGSIGDLPLFVYVMSTSGISVAIGLVVAAFVPLPLSPNIVWPLVAVFLMVGATILANPVLRLFGQSRESK